MVGRTCDVPDPLSTRGVSGWSTLRAQLPAVHCPGERAHVIQGCPCHGARPRSRLQACNSCTPMWWAVVSVCRSPCQCKAMGENCPHPLSVVCFVMVLTSITTGVLGTPGSRVVLSGCSLLDPPARPQQLPVLPVPKLALHHLVHRRNNVLIVPVTERSIWSYICIYGCACFLLHQP